MDKTLQQSEVLVLRKQLERKALRRNVLEGVIIHPQDVLAARA